MNEKYFEANKKMWNEFAKEHFKTESNHYNVREFLEGKTTLRKYELEEVGDVKGKKLLHLQCHFGLDTLSWEREGAIVTGVDFSDEAIKLAKQLNKQANLKGDFILSNVYDLPNVLNEKFDVVYTSVGVLCWLNDLKKWAEVIAYFLKSGGIFYIHDGHP
ncbi:MAG: class I SAM-dependent methyltransferase, partial [Candidatus Heimdallarchaeota archaeon]